MHAYGTIIIIIIIIIWGKEVICPGQLSVHTFKVTMYKEDYS